ADRLHARRIARGRRRRRGAARRHDARAPRSVLRRAAVVSAARENERSGDGDHRRSVVDGIVARHAVGAERPPVLVLRHVRDQIRSKERAPPSPRLSPSQRFLVSVHSILMLLLIALVLAQTPAALSGTKHSDPIPAELSPAVAQALAPGGVRAALVDNSLTFWWVKALALTGTGSSAAWSDVAEGTLVGAVKIDRDIRDIRGKNVKAGVYTLRYGIQPANGDHLGVSPFREFLLLCPAGADTDAAARGHDGTI